MVTKKNDESLDGDVVLHHCCGQGQATLPDRDDDHQHPTKLGSIVRLLQKSNPAS